MPDRSHHRVCSPAVGPRRHARGVFVLTAVIKAAASIRARSEAIALVMVAFVVACTGGGGPSSSDTESARSIVPGPGEFGPRPSDCAPDKHLESLEPTLDCIAADSSGTSFAVFGYRNGAAEAVSVPLGGNNAFIPGPTGRGQPSMFEPGVHHGAFSVKLGGGSPIASWYLGERVASSSSIAPTCDVTTSTDGEYATLGAGLGGGVILLSEDPDTRFSGAIVATDAVIDPQRQTATTSGTLTGEFGVNATGAASYSVPLVVPPGRAGIQPTLSLDYSSHGGNGLVGVGWALSGLPRIARCPKTLASDGHAAPIVFDSSDRLCLDGDYLIPITDGVPIGQGTVQYAPEHNPFVRIVAVEAGDGSDSMGPLFFRMYLKNGQVFVFGETLDSRLEGERVTISADPADVSPAIARYNLLSGRLAWALNEITDRNGNELHVEYSLRSDVSATGEHLGYEHRPTAIRYTTGLNHVTPTRRVEFQYEPRPDTEDRWIAGMHLRTATRLREIDAFAPAPSETQFVASYRLSYKNDSLTTRSLLSALTECDRDNICLPATTFDWELGTAAYRESTVAPPPADGKQHAFAGFASGDIDGDGRGDVVYLNEFGSDDSDGPVQIYEVVYRLSAGDSLGPEQPSGAALYVIPGDAPGMPSSPAFPPPAPRLIDLDADGRDELIAFGGSAAGYPRQQWRIYRYDGSHFVSYESEAAESGGVPTDVGGPPIAPGLYVADLDGDGLPDVARRFMDSDTTGYWAYRHDSTMGLSPYTPFPTTGPDSFSLGLFQKSPDRAFAASTENSGRQALLVKRALDERYTAVTLGPTGIETQPTALPVLHDRFCDEWGVCEYLGGFHYQFVDYNGDGLTDTLIIPNGSPVAGTYPEVGGTLGLPQISINTGVGFLAPRPVGVPGFLRAPPPAIESPTYNQLGFNSSDGGRQTGVLTGDFNEDGKPDLYLTGWDNTDIHPNSGTVTPARLVTPVWLSSQSGFDFDVLPAIPIVSSGSSPSEVSAQCRGIDDPEHPIDGSFATSVTLDVNGDGLTDLFQRSADNACASTLYLHDGQKADMLKGIRTGLGGKTSIQYRPFRQGLGDVKGPACAYPMYCVVTGDWVVSEFSTDRGDFLGAEGGKTYKFSYSDARYDLTGRGFLGFGTREIEDPLTGSATFSRFDNTTRVGTAYPFAGVAFSSRTETPIAGGSVLTETQVSRLDVLAGPPDSAHPFSVAPSDTLHESGDGTVIRSIHTTVARDEFGSVHRIEVTTGDGTSNVTDYAYENYPDRWLVGLLATSTRTDTASGGESTTRTTVLRHDATTGLVREVDIQPGGRPSERLTKTFVYDREGITTDVVEATAAGTRITSTTLDEAEGMFPEVVTNALGQSTHYSVYPSFGVVVSTRDPNGVVTRRRYDGFARLREIHSATGDFVRLHYDQSYFGRPTLRIAAGSSPEQTIAFDTQGRQRRRWIAGFDGTPSITDVSYDEAHPDRTSFESRPYSPGATALVGDRMAYDAAGRLTSLTHPDSTELRWTYAGLTTTRFDEKGHAHSETRDERGRVVLAQDQASHGRLLSTRYEYGAFDVLRHITDPLTNRTDFEYDVLGRQVAIHDPDAGNRRIYYDAFGDTLVTVDGNSDGSYFAVDALGREVGELTKDGLSCTTWDGAEHGIGRVATATSFDGIKTSFRYDALGRPRSTTVNVHGESFALGTTFDDVGRVSTVRYPMPGGTFRPTVQYGYTATGYLSRATALGLDPIPIWAVDRENASGQIETEHFGNGITTTNSYDPRRGWLLHSHTARTSTALRDLTYTYEPNGNVASKVDPTRKNGFERLSYDELDRLVSWHTEIGKGGGTGYRYDDVGNLLQRGSTHFVVGGAGRGPHQLASASDQIGAFTYDGNGDLIVAPNRSTAYSAFDLPRAVLTPTGTAAFEYDAFHHRTVKRGPTGTTVYVGDFYERRTASDGSESHVFKIYAQGRVVAQWVWTPTAPSDSGGASAGGKKRRTFDKQLLFVSSDAIGSTNVVTDLGGDLVEVQRFDPWGNRVDPDDPTKPPSPAPGSGVTIGFAGAEHDDDLGLINMRGRMYDPRLARFVTPDPLIDQSGRRTQALNPYSYTLNNPARFVDPTGFEADEPADVTSAGEGETADPAPSDGPSGETNIVVTCDPGDACYGRTHDAPTGKSFGDDAPTNLSSPATDSSGRDAAGTTEVNQAVTAAAKRIGEYAWSTLKSMPSVYSVYAMAQGGSDDGFMGVLRNLPMAGGLIASIQGIVTADEPLAAANEALNPTVVVLRAIQRYGMAANTGDRVAAGSDVLHAVGGLAAVFAVPEAAEGEAATAERTWESFLPQAEKRVAQAYETYGGRSGVEAMARFTEDQSALIDLAKAGQRTGLTPVEADTMMQWAQEYGISVRNDIGKMHWVGGDHIHIGPVNHIPVGP